MPIFTRLTLEPSLGTLRLLMLVAALLHFASAAAAHGHEGTTPAQEPLCAICVYAGGTLGVPATAHTVPLERQWHALPVLLHAVFVPARRAGTVTIRGPPLSR